MAAPTADPREPRQFHESLRSFLRSLSDVQRRFWVLVVAVGVAAGVGAALLIELLAIVESLAWPAGDTLLDRVQVAPPAHRVLVLAAAGALVTLVGFALRQPTGGHGTAGILTSVWTGRDFSLKTALVRGVLTIVVVGMGAPLGREGALMSTGAGVGWFAGKQLRLDPHHVRLLVACGASAGIAAAYNVPIGGALFGLEVILGSFALDLFGPVVVCCVVATLVSRALVHAHAAFLIPEVQLAGPADLAAAVIAAPLLGIASAFFVWSIERFALLGDRGPRWLRPLLPPAIMAAVGATAIRFPQILGNGYDAVDLALGGALPIALLFALPFLKLVASGATSGAGVPGGLFTPSLFFGGMLGGGLGAALHLVWAGAPPVPAMVLLGMGAGLAGTTHASMAAVLIIFEMTRDYAMVVPLLLACFASSAVSRAIVHDSIYTGVLRRRGIRLPSPARPGWLEEGGIEGHVRPPHTIAPGTPFAEIAVKLLEVPWGVDLHVVDTRGRWLGTASLAELKAHLPDQAALSMVVAADVMNSAVSPLTMGSTLGDARDRLATTRLEELPVVDADGKLVGTVRRGEL